MKSVVTGRDSEGRPVWNAEYAAFMDRMGFRTRLCKPRHPFTKGQVERLVRHVKENMVAGYEFTDLTRLNEDAMLWCARQAARYRQAADCVPADEHASACMAHAHGIPDPAAAELYLCPRRKISFDGFVSFEGRRFGVPYWYDGQVCRVSREGRCLHVYSEDLSRELVAHEVTWSRGDAWCEGQWADPGQPEELPSQPVTTTMAQAGPPAADPGFAKFDFERMVM